jgi:hypothetical protein
MRWKERLPVSILACDSAVEILRKRSGSMLDSALQIVFRGTYALRFHRESACSARLDESFTRFSHPSYYCYLLLSSPRKKRLGNGLASCGTADRLKSAARG